MKVALCLHGYFDSHYDNSSIGGKGFKYIQKKILNKFNPDIYIHTWDKNNFDIINKIYNPKKIVLEQQIDFSKIVEDNGLKELENQSRPPQTVLSHLYSVSKSIELCLDSGLNYDLIIKARFDLGQINRNTTSPIISLYSYLKGNGWIYPVQCISFPKKIESDKLYIAHWEKFDEGPADIWYYGSENIMKPFSKLFQLMKEEFKMDSQYYKFCKDIKTNETIDISNAIHFYKFFMLKNKLWGKLETVKSLWS